jgi:hypothetical protein
VALGYRVYNTHLRWEMLPPTSDDNDDFPSVKYIYVVRDGRDVLTSFYHHLSNQHPDDGGFQGTFPEFLEQFLQGTIAYGKWSHHLASWMPVIESGRNHSSKLPVLLVQYEDLKADLQGQIVRIGQFLGLSSFRGNDPKLQQDKVALNRVLLERVSFDYMRKHQELYHPISVRWKPGYHFIRSGTVGDYKSFFTEEQRRRFMDTVEADFRELAAAKKGDDDDGPAIPSWLYKVGFVDKN